MTYEEYFGDWAKVIDYDELTEVLKKVNIEYNTKSMRIYLKHLLYAHCMILR